MANGLLGVGGALMLAGSPGAMGAGEPAVNGTIYMCLVSTRSSIKKKNIESEKGRM